MIIFSIGNVSVEAMNGRSMLFTEAKKSMPARSWWLCGVVRFPMSRKTSATRSPKKTVCPARARIRMGLRRKLTNARLSTARHCTRNGAAKPVDDTSAVAAANSLASLVAPARASAASGCAAKTPSKSIGGSFPKWLRCSTATAKSAGLWCAGATFPSAAR